MLPLLVFMLYAHQSFACVQPAVRRGSAGLVGFLFKNTKLGVEEDVPNLLTTLVVMLTDNDQSTVQVLEQNPLFQILSSLFKLFTQLMFVSVCNSLIIFYGRY